MTIKVGDMFLQQRVNAHPQITIVIELSDDIIKYKEINEKGFVQSGQLGKNTFETWAKRNSTKLTE